MTNLSDAESRGSLQAFYRSTLMDDVIPFWLRHAIDSEHGGYFTALARDGSVIDTDKSIWFQGRGAWMFSVLAEQESTASPRRAQLVHAAATGIDFLRRHAVSPDGKLYFTVTREGRPLRMRRYVYSEAFAAIALSAYSRIADDKNAHDESLDQFARYLRYSFEPGHIPPKVDQTTRPTRGIGSLMIAIITAQELRNCLGDLEVLGRSMTKWIDFAIEEIETYFLKPSEQVLMEVVGLDGSILDHFDARQLNPGHAIECAWFIMQEGKLRNDRRLISLGCTILDWMWQRGWDQEFGGLLYFCDVRGLPVQEYWHDMKFWWPHCEAIIATLLAWQLTGNSEYARMHSLVHDWSFKHFPDPQHGEWFGYLHRDGRVSVTLKGNMWKGPFHLPRMLWTCAELLNETVPGQGSVP